MATILFAAAGSALGAGFGGSVLGLSGAVIGRAVGATLGQMVDQRVMGLGAEPVEVGRLDRFHVMGASEGASIAKAWGRVRLPGQVIWASPFQEIQTTTSSGGGKGASPPKSQVTQYSYRVSLALALCEGEILGIGRIWADGSEIAPKSLNLRVYRGDEQQLPDPLIEAFEGQGKAPSYRGIAYVVIESMNLTPYGNRVPQLSIEVMRRAQGKGLEGRLDLQEVIQAVALIPGTGEYALATDKVKTTTAISVFGDDGYQAGSTVNQHSRSQRSDLETALGQLQVELPKCSHASLVVSWFGNDLRCGQCSIEPKVEQREKEAGLMPWRAGGIARDAAKVVPRVEGRSIYGGTPSDASVIQSIQHLKALGQNVMFYPFVLMDQLAGNDLPDPYTLGTGQAALPWRGRITTSKAPGRSGSPDGTAGAATEVAAFFGAAQKGDFTIAAGKVTYNGPTDWGYRRFILHYAHLCHVAGGVEAFCIGSELRGLTQIRGAADSFPAVEALKALAADVRAILGPGVKLSYAADWSEYFGYHTAGNVYFHLDPLWADPAIDFIGIDNYMPLSDWRSGEDHADAGWGSIYNLDYLTANVCGGEGFDWYYDGPEGEAAQRRLPILDEAHGEDWIFRYKDLRSWWSEPHHNRIGGTRATEATAWQPCSKPIRFTEYGCAAIDKGTNAPNRFLDSKSSESAIPRESTALRDDFIQMQYYRAHYAYWSDPAHNPVLEGDTRMLDLANCYAWCWDARPYPDFPRDLTAWGDGENYFRGHWLNGRATAQPLETVVAEICGELGLEGVQTNTLYGLTQGYVSGDTLSGRARLQPLTATYAFDCLEHEGRLGFRSRAGRVDQLIMPEGIALETDGQSSLEKIRASLPEGIGRMRFGHVASEGNFEITVAEALGIERMHPTTSEVEFPIVMPGSEGHMVAARWLAESLSAQDHLKLHLPPSATTVVTGSIIGFEGKRYRVDRVELTDRREIEALRIEPHLYGGGEV